MGLIIPAILLVGAKFICFYRIINYFLTIFFVLRLTFLRRLFPLDPLQIFPRLVLLSPRPIFAPCIRNHLILFAFFYFQKLTEI